MIKISEVLPNPVGVDRGSEYIILVNEGNAPESLVGWKVRDKSGKEFSLSGYAVGAGEGLKISDSVSGIALNNSEEVLELLNPAGEVVDRLEYSVPVGEGVAILQNAELTPEIKEQLFEDLAGPGQTVEEYANANQAGLLGPGLVVALVLAVAGSFLIKRLRDGEKD